MEKKRYPVLISAICIAAILVFFFYNTNSEKRIYRQAQALMDGYEGDLRVLQKAEGLLVRMVRSNPNSAPAHAGLGRLAYKSGYINRQNYEPAALEAARDQLSTAIRLDSTFFDAYYYSAYLEMFSEDLDAARRMAARAQALDPGSLKLDLFFSDLALREDDCAEALRRCLSILQNTSDKFLLDQAFSNLSTAYERMEKYDLAEEAYLEELKLNPKSAWALINYCHFLIRRERFDDAIAQGEKSLRAMDFGMGHHVLALAYYKKGADFVWNQKMYDEAIPPLLKAIEHEPTANAYYSLGIAHWYIADRRNDRGLLFQAKMELQKALELEPDHRQARHQLADLQAMLN